MYDCWSDKGQKCSYIGGDFSYLDKASNPADQFERSLSASSTLMSMIDQEFNLHVKFLCMKFLPGHHYGALLAIPITRQLMDNQMASKISGELRLLSSFQRC